MSAISEAASEILKVHFRSSSSGLSTLKIVVERDLWWKWSTWWDTRSIQQDKYPNLRLTSMSNGCLKWNCPGAEWLAVESHLKQLIEVKFKRNVHQSVFQWNCTLFIDFTHSTSNVVKRFRSDSESEFQIVQTVQFKRFKWFKQFRWFQQFRWFEAPRWNHSNDSDGSNGQNW